MIKDKYIKYKTKYLEVKNINNQIGGGNLIIHISGPQGAGKTTLGNKIKEKYNDMIYMKDLDDLYDEFINIKKISWNDFKNQKEIHDDCQEFINNFIKKNSNKPLIIVGLCTKCEGNMNDTFFNIDTKYKYLIKNENDNTLRQRFLREVSRLNDNKEIFFNDWLKDNNKIQEKLLKYINLNKWKSDSIVCNTIHKKYKYKLMNINNIYKKACDLINKKLQL